jgi:hypothetical protein
MPNANDITIHHSLPYTTTKAQANGKLSEQKSNFVKAPLPPLRKEVVMQKRVFSVASFFDTFLAVQKSMPNAYIKKLTIKEL